jgi:CubicO group peptidase (beta-lactamase class C family)
MLCVEYAQFRAQTHSREEANVIAHLLLAVLPLVPQGKGGGVVTKGEAGASIARYVEAAERQGFSGAVLAARKGEVVAAVAAGPLEHGKSARLTPDTLFEIASASKPFTALALVQLEGKRKLKLADPLAEHLSPVPENCAKITLQHLVQHTSGIPATNSEGGGEELEPFLRSVLRGGPVHEPGSHFEYWNQGYALLSEVIAKASGKSYVDQLRASVFEPAGMKSTCFTGGKAPARATVAVGRSSRGASRSALEHPYGAYGLQYRGMGGIVTNVWDLWRFDRALAGKALVDEAAKKRIFEPGLESYALGWRVFRGPNGRLRQSHGGDVRGFTCELRRLPDQDGAVIVLCNDDAAPSRPLADAVEALLCGDKAPPMPPPPLEVARRDALVGAYVARSGRRIVIEAQGELAAVRIEWGPPSGPVTRGVLGGVGDALVVFTWTEASELKVKGAGAALSLRYADEEYVRP